MRIAIGTLALLVFWAVSPAHAAPGNAPPGPSASQATNAPGKPEKSEKPDEPSKPEKPAKPDKPDKPAPPGGPPSSPGTSSIGSGTGGPSAATPFDPVDQDEALRAVERREALPLAHIVTIAEGRRAGGHVINARLVRIEDYLLYQLTMLDDTGRSWRDYYYARSGNPVEID